MRVTTVGMALMSTTARSLAPGSAVPKFAVLAHTGAAVSEKFASNSILWFYPKADTGG